MFKHKSRRLIAARARMLCRYSDNKLAWRDVRDRTKLWLLPDLQLLCDDLELSTFPAAKLPCDELLSERRRYQ
jgi:hypothetical protein